MVTLLRSVSTLPRSFPHRFPLPPLGSSRSSRIVHRTLSSCFTPQGEKTDRARKDTFNRKTFTAGTVGGVLAGSLITGAGAYALRQKKADDSVNDYIKFMKENLSTLGPLGNHRFGEIEILLDKHLIPAWNKEHPDRPAGIWGKTPWHVVFNHLVKFPNGNIGTYLRVVPQQHLKGGIIGAVSLPILPDGRILLVFNYRLGPTKILGESIRGFTEGREPALDVLAREVREETGAKIIKSTSEYLGKYRSDSALTTGDVPIYSVSISEFGEPERDDGEEGCMHLFAFTRDELDAAIERGYVWVMINGTVQQNEIGTDGFLLSALYLYDLRHPRSKKEIPQGTIVQGSTAELYMKPFELPSKLETMPQ
jgi:hypothetical protein